MIVLVITIIVIIILAVAVILTIANNNPIENAKIAVTKHNEAQAKEMLELIATEWKTNGYLGDNQTLDEFLTSKKVDGLTYEKEGEIYSVKYNGQEKIMVPHDKELISFSINGTPFTAVGGMTWEEFMANTLLNTKGVTYYRDDWVLGDVQGLSISDASYPQPLLSYFNRSTY